MFVVHLQKKCAAKYIQFTCSAHVVSGCGRQRPEKMVRFSCGFSLWTKGNVSLCNKGKLTPAVFTFI